MDVFTNDLIEYVLVLAYACMQVYTCQNVIQFSDINQIYARRKTFRCVQQWS